MKIRFVLSYRRFVHEIARTHNTRSLIFNAHVEYCKLDIKEKGPISKGYAEIKEKDPIDGFGKIEYLESLEWNGQLKPHSFRVTAQVPPATFQALLDHDEKFTQGVISLSFEAPDSCFYCGPDDDDGTEIFWDVGKKRVETATSIHISIQPKNEPDNWI